MDDRNNNESNSIEDDEFEDDMDIENNMNNEFRIEYANDNNNNVNELNNNDNNNVNDDNANESIHSYDEDEDFPIYANRINKKLNGIIKNYKSEIKKINSEIEENRGMVKILDEHTKSVEQQVRNKEMIVDQTKSNIILEEHTLQTVDRQIGKLTSQKKSLEEKEVDLQERFNSLQQNIIKANEKMDNYKLTMKEKLEELEQWALAARQKEDDNLVIQRYLRQDELRVKELMLHIEKLTLDVNRKAHELEKEVTETQAAQIEMEKTTEELKNLQIERQDLLDKLLKTEEQIKLRHEELKYECDCYFNNKTDLANFKTELDNKIESLNNHIKLNKNSSDDSKKREAELFKTRDLYVQNENLLKDIHNDIEIKKNELSALARELTAKINKVNFLKSELETKRKNLDEAKSSFNNKKQELSNNDNIFKSAKQREEEIARLNLQMEREAKNTREKLEKTVNDLYEKSKSLFDLREQEANMIGEINNIISAKKNIKANISKLEGEIAKQQELVYNVDFQIQLMERKVAWVQGKRTQEETNEINNEIEILEKNKLDQSKKLQKLVNSLKMIDEELRTVETKLKNAREEKKRLTDVIEELELENIKCAQDLQKITKKKEDVLVQHDLMKLEIKKLYDRLVNEANQVFKEENRLYQLELSIKEREKEILVHKEILVAEHKAAEEERHKAAMEMSQKLTRCNNLKLKYESIVQKNKKSNEDDSGVGEHSQAYYVIKTAQEKEELQRQKDEMDGKIKKCKKDLQSLYQTMSNLKERNEKLKNSLIVQKTGELDKFKKSELENKLDKESKEMWEKKNELERLNHAIIEGNQTLKEKEAQVNYLIIN
jgi:chromosome segregation ATPase